MQQLSLNCMKGSIRAEIGIQWKLMECSWIEFVLDEMKFSWIACNSIKSKLNNKVKIIYWMENPLHVLMQCNVILCWFLAGWSVFTKKLIVLHETKIIPNCAAYSRLSSTTIEELDSVEIVQNVSWLVMIQYYPYLTDLLWFPPGTSCTAATYAVLYRSMGLQCHTTRLSLSLVYLWWP